MFFNKYSTEGTDYNECVARGNCSISPEIRAIQEIILIFTCRLAFCELKAEELKIAYFENKETVMYGVISLIATPEYSHEQLLDIISKIYSKLLYARKEYQNFCTSKNIKCEDLKLSPRLSPEMTLSEIIREGEKAFLENYKKLSLRQKTLREILILSIKSVCTNLLKLKEYGKYDSAALKKMMEGLNILNFQRIASVKIKRIIDSISATDTEIVKMLVKAQKETYGSILKREVSRSTKPAKALLVSGSNLQSLYEVLENTTNIDIDVYTHSDLLIAHALERFQDFPTLKGHYGSCFTNCIVDFATFPGAILLTKNTFPHIDYLYRGKLFSGEDMAPKGVIKIKNNDYSPLIEASLTSKGFTKGREMPSTTVGYAEKELDGKLDNICNEFNNSKIKNLIIIGMSDFSGTQDEYFRKLFKRLTPDTFVITFSHSSGKDNELFINLVNNLPAVFEIMEKIFSKIDIQSDRLSIFLTKCDPPSVSNIINLHNSGAKKIFLTLCPPYVINPNIQSALKNIYGIHQASNVEEDLKIIYE